MPSILFVNYYFMPQVGRKSALFMSQHLAHTHTHIQKLGTQSNTNQHATQAQQVQPAATCTCHTAPCADIFANFASFQPTVSVCADAVAVALLVATGYTLAGRQSFSRDEGSCLGPGTSHLVNCLRGFASSQKPNELAPGHVASVAVAAAFIVLISVCYTLSVSLSTLCLLHTPCHCLCLLQLLA